MDTIGRGAEPLSHNRKKTSFVKACKPYLFLLPIIAFAVVFVYYPFIRTFLYSFSLVNAKGDIMGFVGFENFGQLFQNQVFGMAIKNTLFLTAMFVPLNLFFSLSCALLANKKRPLSGIYETMFTMPMAVSMPAAAMIFKILLNPTVGIVNHYLGINIGWYTDKKFAIYGILLLCLWMGLAFDFLLFLSAVRAVPEQLMESATIDGAGFFARLFRIQVPLITPTILYVVCTNIVLSMMTAGPVMIITEGGPSRSTTTLIYMMFTSGYQSSNYSQAACISIVTFLLTFGMIALAMFFERKGVYYEQ